MENPDGLIEPQKTTWSKLSGADLSVASHYIREWSGDSDKWSQEKKLKSMHPELRRKVMLVLDALRKRGYQPEIFYGWRSVGVQLQLYSRGNSKVKFSFHNAQRPDGTPNSYAADVVDCRFGWSSQAENSGFWKALGEETKKEALIWGGDWASFPDVAHVQLVPNAQLQQVKRESGL